jgi:hypothetical protein
MTRFKKLFETGDNFHEMPAEHLHAETHQIMQALGHERYEKNTWRLGVMYPELEERMEKIGWKWRSDGIGGHMRHPNWSVFVPRYSDSWKMIHGPHPDHRPK